MVEYVTLTDRGRNGTIVKCDGRIQHEYVKGKGWVRSGVLMEYFCDESPLYELYREIPEEEALRIIESVS